MINLSTVTLINKFVSEGIKIRLKMSELYSPQTVWVSSFSCENFKVWKRAKIVTTVPSAALVIWGAVLTQEELSDVSRCGRLWRIIISMDNSLRRQAGVWTLKQTNCSSTMLNKTFSWLTDWLIDWLITAAHLDGPATSHWWIIK